MSKYILITNDFQPPVDKRRPQTKEKERSSCLERSNLPGDAIALNPSIDCRQIFHHL